jgi:hypothetical protein
MTDVVEHLAAREEQYCDQGHGGPEIAVLQNGPYQGCRDGEECDQTEHGSGYHDESDVVEWSDDGRVRTIWEMTA